MEFHPSSVTIGTALAEKEDFYIPRYQRSYAWEDEELADFYRDIGKLHDARIQRDPRPLKHFFGGILVVGRDVEGSRRRQWEVVDGQQRLTTFSLLGVALIRELEDLHQKISDPESEIANSVGLLIDNSKVKWVAFKELINLRSTTVEKLRLSKADNGFYRELVANSPGLLPQQRKSHHRLLSAFEKAISFIRERCPSEDVDKRFTELSILDDMLSEDCQILWVNCTTRDDAYRLFQVLNDRGTGLSDGDLLRNTTLEAISEYGDAILDDAGIHWDNILRDDFSSQDKYLRWYFTSVMGRAPKSTEIHAEYLEHIFSFNEGDRVTEAHAHEIVAKLKLMSICVDRLRSLRFSEWPYEDGRVGNWHRGRLKNLVELLKNDKSLPLLLSASRVLREDVFSDLVHNLEKFFFRFKMICGGHATKLGNVYDRAAARILRQGVQFEIQEFKDELQGILDTDASSQIFRERLKEIDYSRGYNSRLPLRYALSVIEEYIDSYERGEAPLRVRDKTKVIDPTVVTIEHLYPNNAAEMDRDERMEPLKGKIGNLSLLAKIPNQDGANRSFSDKKEDYRADQYLLTRRASEYEEFNEDKCVDRQEYLLEVADRVFRTN